MKSRANQSVLPQRIGRYDILELLGKGGEGVVMLGHDSGLDRNVAIKLLRPDPSRAQDALVSEARIVSQLQHPNIVTLYDVGTYHDLPYLVFEYIEGESLQARIRRTGKLAFADGVIIMSQILAGVAYLHDSEIVHRDLGPANILLSKNDIPKVTDFGISVLRQAQRPGEERAGTLRYMSPDPFANKAASPASDVFTLAIIFYEMLTGEGLFSGATPDEIINELVNGEAVDVSARGFKLPDKICEVLHKATERDPALRYANARAMKSAMDEFRLPRDSDTGIAATEQAHSTVEFLMRRMEHKRGFSSLSSHVSEVLEITSNDSLAPASRLVNILGKDVTLSQRVLTLANSAYYGNAEITALPRAIVLLGLDQVRMCITSALLNNDFEAGSEILRATLTSSFHSAIFAKAIAPLFGVRNRADAFTGALFHNLGRLLTIHYFEDEFQTIRERAERLNSDELTESRVVLGIAYHELARGVAKRWNFSPGIVAAMSPLARGPVGGPAGDDDQRLKICSAYATAVSQAIGDSANPAERDAKLAALAERVAAAATLSTVEFDSALGEAARLTLPYSKLIKVDAATNVTIARLLEFQALASAA